MIINISSLSKEELVSKLKEIANNHTTKESFSEEMKVKLPGICATIAYHVCDRMKMWTGMAMRHCHKGTIQF